MSDRPNILMILVDQMGADALGCIGNEVIKTPNLERLPKRYPVRSVHGVAANLHAKSSEPAQRVLPRRCLLPSRRRSWPDWDAFHSCC